MGHFQVDTALASRDGVLHAELSPDWEIWGPCGGYLSAIALRAAGMTAPSGHRPVSYSCQYLHIGHAAEVTLESQVVRSGRSLLCIGVQLVQRGKPLMQAQVWTTNRVSGVSVNSVQSPDVPHPEALPLMDDADPNAAGAKFRNNFDRKFVPPDHEASNVWRQWIRFRNFDADGDAFLDAGRAVLLIDTMVLPAHVQGRGGSIDYFASTVTLAATFHDSATGSDWLLADAKSDRADCGAIHGEVAVWGAQKNLIARGVSTMMQSSSRPGEMRGIRSAR